MSPMTRVDPSAWTLAKRTVLRRNTNSDGGVWVEVRVSMVGMPPMPTPDNEAVIHEGRPVTVTGAEELFASDEIVEVAIAKVTLLPTDQLTTRHRPPVAVVTTAPEPLESHDMFVPTVFTVVGVAVALLLRPYRMLAIGAPRYPPGPTGRIRNVPIWEF